MILCRMTHFWMSLKWGGQMNNGKCIYFVEGACEQQLIRVLREKPAKVIPGKIKVFNVIQKLIPKSQLLVQIIGQSLDDIYMRIYGEWDESYGSYFRILGIREA